MGDPAAIPRRGWYDKIQRDVYTLLESPAENNKVRKAVIYIIATLILLNVIAVILETVNFLYLEYTTLFYLLDFIMVIVFTVEYVLRIWCCVKNPLYSDPVRVIALCISGPGCADPVLSPDDYADRVQAAEAAASSANFPGPPAWQILHCI